MKLRKGSHVFLNPLPQEKDTTACTNVFYNSGSITSSTKYLSLSGFNPDEEDAQAKSSDTEPDAVDDEAMVVDDPPSASHGASAKLVPFIEVAETIQEAILSLEYEKGVGDPCTCGRGCSLYRCLDCVQGPISCGQCLVDSHQNNPFHGIEVWSDNHFSKSSLDSLGQCLDLGHNGNPCPNAPRDKEHRHSPLDGRRFTIVHINGMHDMRVRFCHCLDSKSHRDQLLDARLFPATLKQPETAFTFSFLDDFQIHNRTSHKSMHDYHDAIRRKTDAAFPDTVPNRYREALLCNRIWTHLAVVRRSGQAHGIDSEVPHRKKGSLAVRCPACPEPGFNLDPTTLAAALESERHKFTRFFSVDGNFRLQQVRKTNSDPDDVSLNKGNAYFVPDEEYQRYLQIVKPTTDTESTCSHLNAVRMQRLAKFKHARVSGVVSVQCARHGIFIQQGTVDLAKGEEYARTDFALVYALSEAFSLRWIGCSYDVWCQYIIHLLERIRISFPSCLPIFKRIVGAIPKMHIKNHKDRCQYRWAFNFTPHSGETCGETIETSWAELNQAASSTREMNAGHRHDTLDADIGHWNWKKVQTIVKSMTKNYEDCIARLAEYEKAVKALEKTHEAYIETWASMNKAFQEGEGGVWFSVYAVQYDDDERPPTQRKAYDSLIEAEKKSKGGQKSTPGDSEECTRLQFIHDGLLLEAEQYRVQNLVSTMPANDLVVRGARSLLFHRLQTWRRHQKKICPRLKDRIPQDSEAEPENGTLYLPSSFSEKERKDHHLKGLAGIEMALREGTCHDALERIRVAIQTFNHNCRFNREEIFGQGANTRAQAFLRSLKDDQYNDAQVYRVNRDAFIALRYALGHPDILKDPLQPLHDKELWGKNTSFAPQLGDSKLMDPWFWYIRPRKLCKAGEQRWTDKADRAKYHRHLAIRDRCQEEKEILQQDIIRTYKSFERASSIWSSLAMGERRPGAAAYAYKQAAMYRRFKDHTLEAIEYLKIKDVLEAQR